jgi:hypothetical protein
MRIYRRIEFGFSFERAYRYLLRRTIRSIAVWALRS